MRYLARQVAVDAILWDGKEDTFDEIVVMVGSDYEISVIDSGSKLIQMDTEMGVAYPSPGEWIVWDGEFAQAYKDARFKELYAPTTEYILDAQNVQVSFTSAPLHPSQVIELVSEYDIPEKGVGEVKFSPVPKTQEEKVAFRQEWDARVDKGKQS